MSDTVPTPIGDDRAEFNPSFALAELRRILGEHGILTGELTPGQMYTATLAVSAVLRALGVRPAAAPWKV